MIPIVADFSSAKSAFISSFNSIDIGNGDAILKASFTAFATQIGNNMIGYTSTPPPIPIDFSSLYIQSKAGITQEECASLMSTIIDNWFKTGSSILISSSTTFIWS